MSWSGAQEFHPPDRDSTPKPTQNGAGTAAEFRQIVTAQVRWRPAIGPWTKPASKPGVTGARVALPASENLAPAFLEHELECHAADVVLGRAPLLSDDPFVLPGDRVDVQVGAEGGRIIIELYPRNEASGHELLERVHAFVAARRSR